MQDACTAYCSLVENLWSKIILNKTQQLHVLDQYFEMCAQGAVFYFAVKYFLWLPRIEFPFQEQQQSKLATPFSKDIFLDTKWLLTKLHSCQKPIKYRYFLWLYLMKDMEKYNKYENTSAWLQLVMGHQLDHAHLLHFSQLMLFPFTFLHALHE
jgi:hypothetical protein